MVEVANVSPKNQEKLKQARKISDTTFHDRGLEWSYVNHSILILGWGTDPETGTKYWIIRNSYGDKWGD